MAEPALRIDIGFKGGQVLPCRVKQESWESLRKALEDASSERWHELETVDSQVAIDLAEVVYVRLDTEEQKVGF
jgi:hypothetical protein